MMLPSHALIRFCVSLFHDVFGMQSKMLKRIGTCIPGDKNGIAPFQNDPAEWFGNEEPVPTVQTPGTIHGNIEGENSRSGQLGDLYQSGLYHASRSLRAIDGMSDNLIMDKIVNNRAKCPPSSLGT
jgi:hypothetical protein